MHLHQTFFDDFAGIDRHIIEIAEMSWVGWISENGCPGFNKNMKIHVPMLYIEDTGDFDKSEACFVFGNSEVKAIHDMLGIELLPSRYYKINELNDLGIPGHTGDEVADYLRSHGLPVSKRN